MKIRAAIVGIAGLLTYASMVMCQTTDAQVEDLIRQGVGLRHTNDDAAALDLFRRAWGLGHSPRAEAQVALAEQALGRWADADTHLAEALGTNDPWIQANRAALQASLTAIEQHVGSLEVLGGTRGASVSIDGRVVGTLPFAHPVRLVAGVVTMEISAAGYYSISRETTIRPGSLTRESVELRPMRGAASEPASASLNTPAATTPTPSRVSASSTAATAAEQPNAGVDTRLAATIVLAGAGAVGLIAGVVGNVIREGAAAQWNSDMCLSGGNTREQNCAQFLNTVNNAQWVEGIGYVAGGVFAVAAVVLFVTRPAHRTEQRAQTFSCGSGLGAISASCSWRF